MTALHLSEPTIPNNMNFKKFHSSLDNIKNKNLKLPFKRKKYYYPLEKLQTYVNF